MGGVLSKYGIDDTILVLMSTFVVACLFLTFFQKYLTGFIYRMLFTLYARRKGINVKFYGFSFSILTGQFTISSIKIVDKDMCISIKRLYGHLYYWRKIQDYISPDKNQSKWKNRLRVNLNAVKVTIYNRKKINELVAEINNYFENGMTTEEVTRKLVNEYDKNAPFSLDLIYRAVLPFSFRIDSLAVYIGNERLPAYCFFYLKKAEGDCSFHSRQVGGHVKIIVDLKMTGFLFKVLPNSDEGVSTLMEQSVQEIEFGKRSVEYKILEANDIHARVENDLPMCFISNIDELNDIKESAKSHFKITFFDQAKIKYGPHIDKLRSVFMAFFMPFKYNNTVFYADSNLYLKFLDITIEFVQGLSLEIPFYLKNHEPVTLTIDGSLNSEFRIKVPYYISKDDTNHIEFIGEFNNASISSSMTAKKILETPKLIINYNSIYPSIWHQTTNVLILLSFEKECMISFHPYLIDFFTQLGMDWASWSPWLKRMPDPSRHMPYTYNIKIKMENLKLDLFSNSSPEFDFFNEFENHPRCCVESENVEFKLNYRVVEFNSHDKGVLFSSDLRKNLISFKYPKNHFRYIRRGDKAPDHFHLEKLCLSGSYKWDLIPTKDYSLHMNTMISGIHGLIGINSLFLLISTILNYTTQVRKAPKEFADSDRKYQPTPPKAKTHAFINVSIDHVHLAVPYDVHSIDHYVVVDLYELMLSLDSYSPYLQVLLNIDACVAELPETDFIYEQFYREAIHVDRGNINKNVIVNGVRFGMRYITTSNGPLSSVISLDVGRILGNLIFPQLISILELTNSIIYNFFDEETNPRSLLTQQQLLSLRQIRVTIGEISVFVDVGVLGLLTVQIVSGIAVYMDSLIDQSGHYTLYVIIPTIDIVHLVEPTKGAYYKPILRVSTYFTLFRNLSFSDEGSTEEQIKNNLLYDSFRQSNYLKNIDSESKILSFVWGVIPDVPDNFTKNVDIFNKEAYSSTLSEKFEIVKERVLDPSDIESTMEVSVLSYRGKSLFATPNKLAEWLHHFSACRHYVHNFSSYGNASRRESPIYPEGVNPSAYVVNKAYCRMRILIPTDLNIEVEPDFIPVIAVLSAMFSYRQSEQLISQIARKIIAYYAKRAYYNEVTFYVILSQVTIKFFTQNYSLNLVLKDLQLKNRELFKENFNSLMIIIDSISVRLKDEKSKETGVIISLPKFLLSKSNSNVFVNSGNLDINMKDEAPLIISEIFDVFVFHLTGFPKPSFGKRTKDFEKMLKYELKKGGISLSDIYSHHSQLVPIDVVRTISEYHLIYRALGSPEYVEDIVVNEMEESSFAIIRMRIEPPVIRARYKSHNTESSLILELYPFTYISSNDSVDLHAGIKRLESSLNQTVFAFLENLASSKPNFGDDTQNLQEEKHEHQLDTQNISKRKISMHVCVHNINVKFNEVVEFRVQNISGSVTSKPNEATKRRFSSSFILRHVKLSVKDSLSIEFGGFDCLLYYKDEAGALHIYPIEISFHTSFLLNLEDSINELLQSDYIKHSIEKLKEDRHKFILKIKEIYKKRNKKKQSIASQILLDFQSTAQLTLSVDQILIIAKIGTFDELSLKIPRFSGNFSSENKNYDYFAFIHPPIVKCSSFEFSLSDLRMNGSYNIESKCGDVNFSLYAVEFKPNLNSLTIALELINEILSGLHYKERKQKTNIATNLAYSVDHYSDSSVAIDDEDKFSLTFNLNIPGFILRIKDIESEFIVKNIMFKLYWTKDLSFEAILPINKFSIYGSHISFEMNLKISKDGVDFQINKTNIYISNRLLCNLSLIRDKIYMVRKEVKGNQHVKDLIDEKAKMVSKELKENTDTIITRVSSASHADFAQPDERNFRFSTHINDTQVSIEVPQSGKICLVVTFINVEYQRRISKSHSFKSHGVSFSIQGAEIDMDTTELSHSSSDADSPHISSAKNSQHGAKRSSLIKLEEISLTAYAFINKISLVTSISSLSFELYPTFLSTFIKLVKIFTSLSQTETKAEPLPSDSSKLQLDIKIPEKTFEIDSIVRCSETRIVFIQYTNEIKLPSFVLKTFIRKDHIYVMFQVESKLSIVLEQAIIEWIRKLLESSQHLFIKDDSSTIEVAKKVEDRKTIKDKKVNLDFLVLTSGASITFKSGKNYNRLEIESLYLIRTAKSGLMNLFLGNIKNYISSESEISRIFEIIVPSATISYSTNYLFVNINKVEGLADPQYKDIIMTIVKDWVKKVIDIIKNNKPNKVQPLNKYDISSYTKFVVRLDGLALKLIYSKDHKKYISFTVLPLTFDIYNDIALFNIKGADLNVILHSDRSLAANISNITLINQGKLIQNSVNYLQFTDVAIKETFKKPGENVPKDVHILRLGHFLMMLSNFNENGEYNSVLLSYLKSTKIKIRGGIRSLFDSYYEEIKQRFGDWKISLSDSKIKESVVPRPEGDLIVPYKGRILFVIKELDIKLYKYEYSDNLILLTAKNGIVMDFTAPVIKDYSSYRTVALVSDPMSLCIKYNESYGKRNTVHILDMPSFELQLLTEQIDRSIKYIFDTKFNGNMVPDSVPNNHANFVTIITEVYRKLTKNEESSVKKNSTDVKKDKIEYQYSKKEFNFKPPIEIGLGATINIVSILEQLNIKKQEQIPESIFEHVVLPLEKLVKKLSTENLLK